MAPSAPPDPLLTPTEGRVLGFLMRHPSPLVTDLTTAAIGDELGIGHEALRGLQARSPQLARSEVDAKLGIQFWMSTPDAADAID